MLIWFANDSLKNVLNFVGLVGLCICARFFSPGNFVSPKPFLVSILWVEKVFLVSISLGAYVDTSKRKQLKRKLFNIISIIPE